MAIKGEARKRLWARSGNQCAKCKADLVRPDDDGSPGALVGQEAHIIARSPGGARYEPLDPETRDGYGNFILLCANDHTEVDAQPARYTVEVLHAMKRKHELRIATQLRAGSSDGPGPTVAAQMGSGDHLCPLLREALGWYVGTPEGLTSEEEDLIDNALQLTDWSEISSEVEIQGFRAMREAKRSLSKQLNELAEAGFLLLAGLPEATFGAELVGPAVVLEIVRPDELSELRVSAPGSDC